MKSQFNPFLSDKVPFQYALLITSVLSAKLLHLYSHVTSLPTLLFILYLPTFLTLDVVDAVLFLGLVHLRLSGRASILLTLVRGAICLLLLGASSSQIAFYLETGGELKWGAANKFAHDLAGMKILLSGSLYTFLVSIFITTVARLICEPLYHRTRNLLLKIATIVTGRDYRSVALRKESVDVDPSLESGLISQTPLLAEECPGRRLSSDTVGNGSSPLPTGSRRNGGYRRWFARILVLAPVVTVSILFKVRPKDFPYAHMSGSLPFTLLEIWNPTTPDMCQAGYSRDFIPFPFPELLSSEFWEPAHDKFIGWMPSVNGSSDQSEPQGNIALPYWLPREKIDGFERWYDENSSDVTFTTPVPQLSSRSEAETSRKFRKGISYDPVKDPARITNLDQDLLEPILEAVGNTTVRIKHVVIISLESTRKDVFPLKRDSHLHSLVMKSYSSVVHAKEADLELAKLTENAEILTGESGGFEELRAQKKSLARPGSWRNMTKDRGGINVVGALTGSTATFKSFLGSHCGVQPLPVDFTVEAHSAIYQPCLPSILKLFNHNKVSATQERGSPNSKESEHDDIASMPWTSSFIQSITDQYDYQDELNKHVGFNEVIAKDTLLDPSSKHYPPTEKESCYFGFPETQVKPYLQDAFRDAEEKGQRLFLSHFTSSTHHPWDTPEAAGETTDFFRRSRWHPERPLNKYLNTIGYDDKWIGEIMDMLEDLKVAEETLVVLVGDHGMAFREDSSHYTTYENGHISNLRVPLVFHHPSLPRIQLTVNATSMSIIPTILDLLIATSSLNARDTDIAANLIQQYEGQSLIRPYQVQKNGRQAWNIGILSPGGAVLSVSSAAVPFRLVMPVCKSGVYRFTSVASDPNELRPVVKNSISDLAHRLRRKHGDEAADWVLDAEKIGKWWMLEERRRWKYEGASLQDDRSPEEMEGVGKKRPKHWWDT